MPVARAWLVLASFDWSPRSNVIIRFTQGQIVHGLTRACRAQAGGRLRAITGYAPRRTRPLTRAHKLGT